MSFNGVNSFNGLNHLSPALPLNITIKFGSKMFQYYSVISPKTEIPSTGIFHVPFKSYCSFS